MGQNLIHREELAPIAASVSVATDERTRRAPRSAVPVRTAIPSMCALFTRGVSRCEMCQGAKRGVDTEGVAKAGKLECKQSKVTRRCRHRKRPH